MPGFDGTGPNGMGPGTGGRRGFCFPSSRSNYGRLAGGMGFGWRGRGRRRCWYPGPGFYYDGWSSDRNFYRMNPDDELNLLTDRMSFLKEELDQVQKRIDEIKINDDDR